MGSIKHGVGTNLDALKIKTNNKNAGDIEVVPRNMVKRDEHGLSINHWTVSHNTNIPKIANAQYLIVKHSSPLVHYDVRVNSNLISDDTTILSNAGDYFRLGFSDADATLEIRRL